MVRSKRPICSRELCLGFFCIDVDNIVDSVYRRGSLGLEDTDEKLRTFIRSIDKTRGKYAIMKFAGGINRQTRETVKRRVLPSLQRDPYEGLLLVILF